MVSFSSWNGVKLSAHKYLLTDVLKNELGFEGFLVSDWAAIDQLPGDYRAQVKASANAGMDMFMVPYRHREFYTTLRSLVQTGEVPMSRIDDAVRRILRVKFAAGLLDRSPLTDPTFKARFGSVGHREVAREVVRQSVVLLKNQGAMLPLTKTLGRIHISGKSADNIGNQCGGWTIEWQGRSGDITPGTTILEAVRQSVSPATNVSFSADGSGASGADVGIVVIGETPYAEGPGDDADLSLEAQDVAVVDRMRQAGVPVIVVLISGRPLVLDAILGKVEAVLAAWLPGTEAQGVADVIFEDFRPTGKLPCSWPRSMSQIPINVGDGAYDPLFPYGFGLTHEPD
jgi:beta-glucosidase